MYCYKELKFNQNIKNIGQTSILSKFQIFSAHFKEIKKSLLLLKVKIMLNIFL